MKRLLQESPLAFLCATDVGQCIAWRGAAVFTPLALTGQNQRKVNLAGTGGGKGKAEFVELYRKGPPLTRTRPLIGHVEGHDVVPRLSFFLGFSSSRKKGALGFFSTITQELQKSCRFSCPS